MPWRKSELIHYILWIVLEYKSSPDHSILEMPPLGSNHYSILEAAGHSPAFQSSQFLIPPQPCQFHCLTTYTNIWNIIKRVGVLRDTARAPQPPTNPPREHQSRRQGLAQNDQKCQFFMLKTLTGESPIGR